MNEPNFKTVETLKRGDRILEPPRHYHHLTPIYPAIVIHVSKVRMHGMIQFVMEVEATRELHVMQYMPGDSFRVDG